MPVAPDAGEFDVLEGLGRPPTGARQTTADGGAALPDDAGRFDGDSDAEVLWPAVLPASAGGVEAAPPAELVGTPCTSSALDVDPCAGDSVCPLRLSRRIDCPGYLGSASLAFDGERAHLGLWVGGSEIGPERVELVSLDAMGELAAEVRQVGVPAVVALDVDGQPALLEYTLGEAPNRVTMHRADGSVQAFGVGGEPWKLTLAPDGALRVLSSMPVGDMGIYRVWLTEGTTDAELVRRELPGTMRYPVLTPSSLVFLHAEQVVPTLAELGADGGLRSLTTEATSSLSRLAALPARVEVEGGMDDGWHVTWDVVGRVWALAQGGEPEPVVSAPRGRIDDCDGVLDVDTCPDDRSQHPLGYELYDHALARGAAGEPWLVALEADTVAECRWHPVCAAGACHCVQAPFRSAGALRVRVRSLTSGSEHVLPLGELGGRPLLNVAHAAGRIAIAISDTMGEEGSRVARALYLVL